MSTSAIEPSEKFVDLAGRRGQPSLAKTITFIIVLILGLCGLAAAGVELGGYFQVGSLSSLSQVNSIIMMAAGGGGGIVFLIIGIIGSVKNQTHVRGIEYNHSEYITYFGKEGWSAYAGDIGEVPPFPEHIEDIMESPCPFSQEANVKVKDTHMLVLIPATLNGEPVTLNKLKQVMQQPQKGPKIPWMLYNDSEIPYSEGKTAVAQSYWALVMRDVIPKSRNKNYDTQVSMLEGTDYVLPTAIEVIVCILAECATSGRHLYGRDPQTLTRCSTEVIEWAYNGAILMDGHIVVGSFGTSGLSVYDVSNNMVHEAYGIAAKRQFSDF